MSKLKVLLALITQDNDYQREQASVAEATARRLGMELQVLYAEGDAIAQTQQILASIRAPATDRPAAVIVEPVGTGMLPVATAAVKAGVGWIVLNREADYLAPLRGTSSVPIGSLDCDNLEVGRIQGQQFAALLPSGGTVWYIEGPSTEASKQRRVGVEETLPAGIAIQAIRGKWTEESAFQAIGTRLQLQGSQAPNIALIGSQNDAMAMGARKAIESIVPAEHRDQWLSLPCTGVDGVPTSGQLWVRQRLLAATVVTPPLTGIALEMLSEAIESGKPLPERTLTKPSSYPPLEELRASVAATPTP